MNSALSAGDTLTVLLTLESLLLAVVSLTVTLATPVPRASRNFLIGPGPMAAMAVGLLTLTGVGSVIAWFQLFGGGSIHPIVTSLTQIIILIVAVAQPPLAILLALAIRYDR